MDRIFRIDFYPQDWLIDTARLTPEERGIFIQIICLIYSNRGPIENDPVWIAGVSGCSGRLAKSIIKILIDKNFLQSKGSKITQKRAENELNTKRTHLEQSSKGGRTSAENRRQTNEIKLLGSRDPQIPVSSPSPSPTAIDKKESTGRKKTSKSKPAPADQPPKADPRDDKTDQRYDPVAYEGPLMRLRKKDLYAWRDLYGGEWEQFLKWLEQREDWLLTQPPHHSAKWFMSTKIELEKIHAGNSR